MPRPAAPLLALALAAALLFAFGGCGEEDAELLPGSTAREITDNLDTVQQLADEGDCTGAESAALQVGEQVETLRSVDARLKRALAQGAERLEEVVARCEEELEATEPLPSDLETEEADEDAADELEKEEKREEKEQEKREKEEEKREGSDQGKEGEDGGPSPPAEDEGSGNEGEGGGEPPAVEEGAPSGGVSPANPAGEG